MIFFGTQKQQRWANTIYQGFIKQFNAELPNVSEAQFWIHNRNVQTIEDLYQQAEAHTQEYALGSPFTAYYPYYERYHAVNVLAALPESIAVLDVETTGLHKKGQVCELAVVE